MLPVVARNVFVATPVISDGVSSSPVNLDDDVERLDASQPSRQSLNNRHGIDLSNAPRFQYNL